MDLKLIKAYYENITIKLFELIGFLEINRVYRYIGFVRDYNSSEYFKIEISLNATDGGFNISGSCGSCCSVFGLHSWTFYCRTVCYFNFMDVS